MLRQAGLDLERNTWTTSNFEELSRDEIAMVVNNKQTEGFHLEMCYDAQENVLKSSATVADEWGMCDVNVLPPSSSDLSDMSSGCLSLLGVNLSSEEKVAMNQLG